MDFKKLDQFLKTAAASSNPLLRKRANSLADAMIQGQEDESVVAPDFESKEDSPGPDSQKDEVDALILPAFKDLAKQEEDDSTFGKVSSAFTADIELDEVPKETREDIQRLLPIAKNMKAKLVLYGMVVEELLPKVDELNFQQAEERVKDDLNSKGKKALGDKFQDKLKSKYILLLNDKIVDGHHFLALAKVLGITCSLRVLDLTPVRFQLKKSASLIDKLAHEQSNYSRKGGTTVSLYSRIASGLRGERAR